MTGLFPIYAGISILSIEVSSGRVSLDSGSYNLFNDGSYMLALLNTCLNLFLSLGGVSLGKLISHIV